MLKRRLLLALGLALWSTSAVLLQAQPQEWTAESSDPNRLAWMKGFPPASDKLIQHPHSDFFSFPKLRWTVCHIRELLPTREVDRGTSTTEKFEYTLDNNIDKKIDALKFTPLGSNRTMTWQEALAANFTDGIIVIHNNKVIYEKYFGCLTKDSKHTAMSMTKSIVGLLAEILIAEGQLDSTATVASLVPELRQSAFGTATVREVMDMTTALQFDENYANPKADIWTYSQAANPLPKPADYQGPRGYLEYLQQVQATGPHGSTFGYKTINTDALGWIIARVSGKNVADLLAERIWKKMGAAQDAYFTVDGQGTPFAGGGLSATLQDLAKVGVLMLNEGRLNNQSIFPAQVIRNIKAGGSKTAFEKAKFTTLKGGSYRSMWWHFHNKHGAFAARGVHGQTIYIDPTAKMVIVRLASHPKASNSQIDPTSLPAYAALADYLVRQMSIGVTNSGYEK